jgi:hypothetical protein
MQCACVSTHMYLPVGSVCAVYIWRSEDNLQYGASGSSYLLFDTKSVVGLEPHQIGQASQTTSCILTARIKIKGMRAPGFPVVRFYACKASSLLTISFTKIPPDMAE